MKLKNIIGMSLVLVVAGLASAMAQRTTTTVPIQKMVLVSEVVKKPKGFAEDNAFHAAPVRTANASWISAGSFHAAPVRTANASWISNFKMAANEVERIERWLLGIVVATLGIMCLRELNRLSTSIDNLTHTQQDQLLQTQEVKLELREFKATYASDKIRWDYRK